MNSLPLSPLVISFILRDFTRKTTAYKSCVTVTCDQACFFFWKDGKKIRPPSPRLNISEGGYDRRLDQPQLADFVLVRRSSEFSPSSHLVSKASSNA